MASSYEHNEDGSTNEEAEMTVKQNDKRFRKLETLVNENAPLFEPALYGPEDADITIIAWGSSKVPILEALNLCEAAGMKVNFYHFVYLCPFPTNFAKEIFARAKKTFLIEGNKTAQFGGVIREYTGYEVDEYMLSYSGRPFYAEDIFAEIKKII